MPGLFRQRTTRYLDADGKRCKPGDPGARKVVSRSKKWYADVPQPGGGVKRTPLDEDRNRSLRMLAALLDEGQTPPHLAERAKPLEDHLSAFEAEVKSQPRGKRGAAPSAAYVADVMRDLRRCLAGCESPADVTAEAARRNLARLSAPAPALHVPEGEYTIEQAAALLGRHESVLRRSVKRYGLPWRKDGRRRLYHAEVVRTLAGLRVGSRGVGTEGTREAVTRLRRFGEWLAKRCGWARSPLEDLRAPRGEEPRHARRALSDGEIPRLLAAAAQGPPWRGLSGADRRALYLTVLSTGLRKTEAAAVEASWFDLGACPTMTVPASVDKRGVRAVQPLPPDAAAELREYLAGRTGQLWPGSWVVYGADMLRADLEAAGIPYALEGPDGPEYADVHALRHTYVARLDRAGLSLKQAMALARHSTPTLTAKRYGRASLAELADAIGKVRLP